MADLSIGRRAFVVGNKGLSNKTGHRPSQAVRRTRTLLALSAAAGLTGLHASARADTYSNNGGTTLNLPASWIDDSNGANTGVLTPGGTDIAQWDNLGAGGAGFTLGGPVTWGEIKVVSPTAAVTVTDSNILTLNGLSGVGIDMTTATQNLTLNNNLLLGGVQSWTVNTGRTLTIGTGETLDTGTAAVGPTNVLTLGATGTTGAGTIVIAANITDNAGLAINGGVVTLSGTNTYGGNTTLTAGTLNINSGTALGANTSTFTILGGTINNTLGSAVVIANNNNINLNADFTSTGASGLDLGAGNFIIGGTVTNSTRTITANGTGALQIDGVVSSAAGVGVTKAGTGTLYLNNVSNTYSGPTNINAGTLEINDLASLGAGTVLNFNGGILEIIQNTDISTDTVTINSGGASINTNGVSTTFANPIGNNGTGALTKVGAGGLTLSAANTFTGAMNISAGTVTFSALNNLGAGTAINLSGGTLQYAAGFNPDITTRTVTLTTTTNTVDINGNNVSYGGVIGGTGSLNLTNNGAGPQGPGAAATLTLNGANTYSGTTALTAGTLLLGNPLALQNSTLSYNNVGGFFSFGSLTNATLGGLAGAQALALTNTGGGAVNLTINGNAASYAGVLSDPGAGTPATLTKVGTGSQVFAPPAFANAVTTGAFNTYHGNTIVNGGTLQVTFPAPFVSGGIVSNILYSFATSTATSGSLIVGGGTVTMLGTTNAVDVQEFNGLTANPGSSLITQGTRASNQHPGFNLGGLTRTAAGATVDFTPSTGSGGTLTDVTTGIFTTTANGLSGILGGWATVNGGAEWARNTGSAGTNGGNQIRGGATYINAFAANTQNTDMTASLVATASATTGSLRFNNALATTLTLNGANVIATGGILETTTVAGNASVITGGTSLTSGNGTDLIVIQGDTTAGGSLSINTPIVDSISPAGPIALTKAGAGMLILGASNTFSGGVYINNGVLQIGNAGALNSTTPQAINFDTSSGNLSGTLSMAGNSVSVASISTANVTTGTPTIQDANAASATLTLSGSATTTFGGVIQNGAGAGLLGLTLGGSTQLTLTGANTYTGVTTIGAGASLALKGATNRIPNSSNIIVGSGGSLNVTGVTGGFTLGTQTLSGNGSVTGTVNVGSTGGSITPGTSNSIGTLSVTGLNLPTNSTLNMEYINGNPVGDLVNVTVGGGFALNANSASPVKVNLYQSGTNSATPLSAAGTYDLIQYSGSIGGASGGTLSALQSAFTVNDLPTGLSALFGESGGFVTVQITVNPIPTWSLSTGGIWNTGNASWSNWAPATGPTGQGQAVALGDSLATTPANIDLQSTNETIGSIGFNTSNGDSYNLTATGSGVLILDNGTSAGTIADTNGSHTISAPIHLNSNVNFSMISAGTLTVSGVISNGTDATPNLTLSGAGTLALMSPTGNTYGGSTNLGGGTLQVGSNTAVSTGQVNFNSNATLQSGAANLSVANPIALAQPGVIGTIDTQANTMTLSGIISSVDATSTLNKVGSGTLVLLGANSYTAPTTVNAGTLQIGNNGTTNGVLGANSVTLAANTNLTYNTLGAVTVANNIGGAGTFVQNGTNTVTLSGTNNTQGGGIVVNAGTVILGGGSGNLQAAGGGGNITIAGGAIFQMNGFTGSTTPAYGTLNNNVIITNASTTPATFQNTQRGDWNGTLGGSGIFDYDSSYVRGQIDNGIWTFSGQINFIGTSATNTGDIRLATAVFSDPTATVNLAAGTALYSTVNNGAGAPSTFTVGDISGAGSIGTTSAGAFTVIFGSLETAGAITSFTGNIGNGGHNTAITKQGPGTWHYTGSYTASGAITVSQGALTFNGAAIFSPAATGGPIDGISLGSATTGGTLDLAGNSVTAAGLSTATGSPGPNVLGSTIPGASVSVTVSGGTSTFAGTISDTLNIPGIGSSVGTGSFMSLAVTGGATLLTGVNDYTGGTSITGGTLSTGVSQALSFGGSVAPNRTPGSTSVGNGTLSVLSGTLDLDGVSLTEPITLNGGSLVNSSTTAAATLTTGLKGFAYSGGTGFAANASLPISITDNSSTGLGAAGTASTDASGNITGITMITGGTGFNSSSSVSISVSGGGTQPSVTSGAVVSSLSVAGNSYIGGAGGLNVLPLVTGAGGLTKIGAGTTTLSNSKNTFSGNVAINAGVLSATSLGLATGPSSIGQPSGGNVANTLVLSGGTLQYAGTSTANTDRLFTITATGGALDSSGSAPVSFSNTGAIVSSDPSLGVNSDDGGFRIGTEIATTVVTLTQYPYSADLTVGMSVSDGGSFIPAGTTITAINAAANTITLSAAATQGTATAPAADALTFGYAGTTTGTGARTLTLTGSNLGMNTVSGVLTDSPEAGLLSVAKTGVGTWVLAPANTYSGSTSVSAGTLIFGNLSPALSARTHPSLNLTGGVLQEAAASGTTSAPNSGRNVLVVGTPTVAGVLTIAGGTLDLTNNDMVVKGVGSAGLATITSEIKQGFSGNGTIPAWTGTGGITSSTAATNTQSNTALAVVLAQASGTFDGQPVTGGSDVLVKYTYFGDANLDGRVTSNDYIAIDNGFNSSLTGWQNGDFNYDGVVNGDDYTLIDNAYNTEGPSATYLGGSAGPAEMIATNTDQIAGASSSAVPEPTTLGMLGIGAAGLLMRRRRKNA